MLKKLHDRAEGLGLTQDPEDFHLRTGGSQLYRPEAGRIAHAYAEKWAKTSAGRAARAQAQDLGKRKIDRSEGRIVDLDPDQLFREGVEYTPPARGNWTIMHTPLMVPGLHEIYVCPDSCLRGVLLSAEEIRALDRFHAISVTDRDFYNGRLEPMILEGVADIIGRLETRPKAVMVTTACIHDFLGLDRKYIFSKLQDSYPDIDIIPSSMNCTMRKTQVHHEQAQWRQNYRALKVRDHDPKSINVIGSPFPLDKESELVKILEDGGFTIRELATCKSYADYQAMASSSYNIRNGPMGEVACQDLASRLGQEEIYLPFVWNFDQIDQDLTRLAGKVQVDLPDLQALRDEAGQALEGAQQVLGDSEIEIDGMGVVFPCQLAVLLIQHGFHVRRLFMDQVLPEDREAFAWLQENQPDLRVSAMVNFQLRMRGRDRAQDLAKEGKKLLAIGQKAAYFTGSPYFLDLVQNLGLYGYKGIIRLAHAMVWALDHPRSPRDLIQIKAKGFCK